MSFAQRRLWSAYPNSDCLQDKTQTTLAKTHLKPFILNQEGDVLLPCGYMDLDKNTV